MLPSLLSASRIVATPFAAVLILYGEPWVAAAFFAVAVLTDGLDGLVARLFKCKTDLGLFLDTLADKVLIVCILFVMVSIGRVWIWFALFIAMREIMVMGLKTQVDLKEGKAINPSWLGKTKMGFQSVAIFLAIIRPWPFEATFGSFWVDEWLMGIAVFLTLWSGMDYFVGFGRAIGGLRDEAVMK